MVVGVGYAMMPSDGMHCGGTPSDEMRDFVTRYMHMLHQSVFDDQKLVESHKHMQGTFLVLKGSKHTSIRRLARDSLV